MATEATNENKIEKEATWEGLGYIRVYNYDGKYNGWQGYLSVKNFQGLGVRYRVCWNNWHYHVVKCNHGDFNVEVSGLGYAKIEMSE